MCPGTLSCHLSPILTERREVRGCLVSVGCAGSFPLGFQSNSGQKEKEKSHNMLQVGGLEAVDELLMSIIPVFPLEVGG